MTVVMKHPIWLLVAFTALGSSVAAAGGHAPIHPEQMMFDTKPITATSPGPGKDSFKITDHIYARVFFDKPIKDVFKLTPEHSKIEVPFSIDEIQFDSLVEILVPKKDFGNKWIDLEILPDPATAHTKYVNFTFLTQLKFADKLKGPRKLWLRLRFGNSDELSAADDRAAIVTVNFDGVDLKRLESDDKKTMEAGNKAYASNIEVPKRGRLHSATFAKQLEAMTKRGSSDLVAVKVIITDDDWDIERNDAGAVTSRTVGVATVTKTRDGKCELDAGGMIRQQYVGGKFRGPGEWANTAAQVQVVDCKVLW